MLDKTPTARIVMTTTATPEDARALGKRLVEERLAACASVIPAVESIYRWEGAIEDAKEVLLLLKTVEARLEALEARLIEVHPYRAPEFLVLAVDSGGSKYLEWLTDSLRS